MKSHKDFDAKTLRINGYGCVAAGEHDLKSEARLVADSKVMRFLDPMAAPPFVAAARAIAAAAQSTQNAIISPDEWAVFTASKWDPNYRLPVLLDDVAPTRTNIAQHYASFVVPTEWLRQITNNAACHIAVAHQFTGPNLHLSGDSSALENALFLAADALSRSECRRAVIAAFDAVGPVNDDPTASGYACAIVVSAEGPGVLTGCVPPAPRPTDSLRAMIEAALQRAEARQGAIAHA